MHWHLLIHVVVRIPFQMLFVEADDDLRALDVRDSCRHEHRFAFAMELDQERDVAEDSGGAENAVGLEPLVERGCFGGGSVRCTGGGRVAGTPAGGGVPGVRNAGISVGRRRISGTILRKWGNKNGGSTRGELGAAH